MTSRTTGASQSPGFQWNPRPFDRVLTEIESAQDSLKWSGAGFRGEPAFDTAIVDALVRKAQSGKAVSIEFAQDEQSLTDRFPGLLETLRAGGVQVEFKQEPGPALHTKMLIVDVPSVFARAATTGFEDP